MARHHTREDASQRGHTRGGVSKGGLDPDRDQRKRRPAVGDAWEGKSSRRSCTPMARDSMSFRRVAPRLWNDACRFRHGEVEEENSDQKAEQPTFWRVVHG